MRIVLDFNRVEGSDRKLFWVSTRFGLPGLKGKGGRKLRSMVGFDSLEGNDGKPLGFREIWASPGPPGKEVES